MIYTLTPNPVLDRTLTVPEIIMNEMARATEAHDDWGGKGFNVSRALKAQGVNSVALGFTGGATGDKLAQGLGEWGITTDLVNIAGETRTNIVITDAQHQHYIKVNEAGPTVTYAEMDAMFMQIRTLAQPDDVWALCGSLPPGVPVDFYAQAITLLKQAGAAALLDTSDAALQAGIAAGPYLIKPNNLEATAILGRNIESIEEATEAAQALVDQGVHLVALSLGKRGLILASADEAWWACPPQVKAQNPVGAGDASLAGVILGMTQDASLAEMARWGVASGTAAAVTPGVGVGTVDEVQTLYAQVTVKQVR